MVRVKICGITNIIDAENAVLFGADALGFVFTESPRQITPEAARSIIEKLPPFITCVGVFVNEDIESVRKVCQSCRINTVQFHGDESQDYMGKFPDFKIIKAIKIRNKTDLLQLKDLHADAYLLDSYSRGKMGGTGTTFDWRLAEEIGNITTRSGGLGHQGKPKRIIVAGGLNPDNVIDAIQRFRPFAVDVSSGIELRPGTKDKGLMKRFISNAKGIPVH